MQQIITDDAQEAKNNCPICHVFIANSLREHIRKEHSEEEFRQAVLKVKEQGMSDPEIGSLFGVTFKQLEEIITEAYGINISTLKKPKKVKSWVPKKFKEKNTTVWSFKQRGNWATHDGRYRGNWSPYIPRNVILKYSSPGDIVLDYFVGGGTTAVEAKLLGRRCIARDINPAAIGLTKENLNFTPSEELFERNPIYEPEVSVGDARDLSDMPNGSIDLICTHPPYAGIINYSSKVEGDLSKLNIEEFLDEMGKVAKESYRVLKPGGKCAILIGDTRKHKHVVPIGFQTINVFMDAGFKLRNLVIKRQHNCKSTGFWYKKSIKYNFLLLAHEYLPIFEKPSKRAQFTVEEKTLDYYGLVGPNLATPPIKPKLDELETTTVWLFPRNEFEQYLNKNVIERYSKGEEHLTISFTSQHGSYPIVTEEKQANKELLFIKSPFLKNNPSLGSIEFYLQELTKVINRELYSMNKGGSIVVHTQDVRVNGYVEPVAKKVVDTIKWDNLWLKEIVIVTQVEHIPEEQTPKEDIEINHQYLLVYEVIE